MVTVRYSVMNPDEIEARLIEACRVFERLERKGRAFATDGPWAMMRMRPSERYGLLNDQEEAARRLANAIFDPRPDRDMIARAEISAGWLGLIGEGERRIVLTGVRFLADNPGARIPWLQMIGFLGLKHGAEGLRKRYGRALASISRAVRSGDRDACLGPNASVSAP